MRGENVQFETPNSTNVYSNNSTGKSFASAEKIKTLPTRILTNTAKIFLIITVKCKKKAALYEQLF